MTRLALVILIVQDEFLLRLDSAETIESAGFEVIQAANADEAIAILKVRPIYPSRIFTDIQMPGSMDGHVATSGRVMVGDDDLPDGSVFLPKPYRGAEVVATLRELTALPDHYCSGPVALLKFFARSTMAFGFSASERARRCGPRGWGASRQ